MRYGKALHSAAATGNQRMHAEQKRQNLELTPSVVCHTHTSDAGSEQSGAVFQHGHRTEVLVPKDSKLCAKTGGVILGLNLAPVRGCFGMGGSHCEIGFPTQNR